MSDNKPVCLGSVYPFAPPRNSGRAKLDVQGALRVAALTFERVTIPGSMILAVPHIRDAVLANLELVRAGILLPDLREEMSNFRHLGQARIEILDRHRVDRHATRARKEQEHAEIREAAKRLDEACSSEPGSRIDARRVRRFSGTTNAAEYIGAMLAFSKHVLPALDQEERARLMAGMKAAEDRIGKQSTFSWQEAAKLGEGTAAAGAIADHARYQYVILGAKHVDADVELSPSCFGNLGTRAENRHIADQALRHSTLLAAIDLPTSAIAQMTASQICKVRSDISWASARIRLRQLHDDAIGRIEACEHAPVADAALSDLQAELRNVILDELCNTGPRNRRRAKVVSRVARFIAKRTLDLAAPSSGSLLGMVVGTIGAFASRHVPQRLAGVVARWGDPLSAYSLVLHRQK